MNAATPMDAARNFGDANVTVPIVPIANEYVLNSNSEHPSGTQGHDTPPATSEFGISSSHESNPFDVSPSRPARTIQANLNVPARIAVRTPTPGTQAAHPEFGISSSHESNPFDVSPSRPARTIQANLNVQARATIIRSRRRRLAREIAVRTPTPGTQAAHPPPPAFQPINTSAPAVATYSQQTKNFFTSFHTNKTTYNAEDNETENDQIRRFASFHCPITLDLMTDPVIASDGFTYERSAIEQWRDKGGTSPFTREALGPDLIPNLLVSQLLADAITSLSGRTSGATQPSTTQSRCRNLPVLAGVDYSIAAVSKLGEIFATLDPLRDTLSSMLDGWAAPQIVVIGNENSGKSTLLERLTMIPLFPRDRKLGTRMPIEVKLRRGKATPVIMHLVEVATGELIEGSEKIFAAEMTDTGVVEQMRDELERVNGSVNGVCHDRRIVLQLARPDLPNLDFLDLPGLVAGAMRNEPSDMREQTRKLVESNVQRIGDAGLFLWTASAATPVNQSLAADIINHSTRAQRTIGVITKLDLVNDDEIDMMCDQVTQDGDAVVELHPNGFVATMLKMSKTPDGSEGQTNIERLIREAKNEEAYFHESEALARIIDAGRGGCNKLIDRLGVIVNTYVGKTWAPQTIRLIDERVEKIKEEETKLGMPRAHTAELLTTELKTKVCKLVAETIIARLPSLMKKFTKSQLLPFKTALMIVTYGGATQTINPISVALAFTDRMHNAVETTCLNVVKSTQIFLLSHVLESLTGDFSPAKLGRFENLIAIIRTRINIWLILGRVAVNAEVRRHIANFFDQVPTNTVCITALKLDDDGGGSAEITCDGLALWNTVSRVLVKHAGDMITMLERMLEEYYFIGGLVSEMKVEAYAVERAKHLAHLKKLSRAKTSILKLIGKGKTAMNALNLGQAMCIQTFKGHMRGVTSVCETSDNTRLVTGSLDNTAKLWDVKTGECIRTFAGHTSVVYSVCLTCDNMRLVTASGDFTVKLWHVEIGDCLRIFRGHNGLVYSACLTSDNMRLVTASGDRTAKLWNIKTEKCIRTFTGHTNFVSSVCLTSDDTRLVTGSYDKTAKLWDIETGKCIRTFTGHTSLVSSVCLTSDDTRLVTGSYDKTAKLWDVETGECIRTFMGHMCAVHSACLTSNDTRLITGSDDKTAKLWDVETGGCIRTFSNHTAAVRSVCITTSNAQIFTGSDDSTAKLWGVDRSISGQSH